MKQQQPHTQPSTLLNNINNNSSSQPQGESLRKKYTSHNQQMPGQLSYQNIKLANFIQLQLADLWDSLQHISRQNFKNQLKQSLSRSYNVFHQMNKLYADLGMNFLYSQSKKLISSYGIIFVYLLERVDQYQKFRDDHTMKNNVLQKVKTDSFQEEVKRDIQNYKIKKLQKDTKKHKRMGGIHLFNQSYARRIDYDVQAFRQLRESIRQKSQQQKQAIKLQQDRKFKKEVLDQINDYSHLRVDGEELYLFLNRHQNVSEIANKICLGDQLEKIAGFFKESQHQALQFLRKQKHLQSFHELTEGFNSIVSDYQVTKANQIFFVKDKIKQIFEYIQSKTQHLQHIVEQKGKQILLLKDIILKKNVQKSQVQTQTFYSFDDEIKHLYRRILTTEMMNQQLKTFISKTGEQQRKQKLSLMQQIGMKQSSNRQIKEVLEDKLTHIIKVQRKLKLLMESNKSKNVKDPIQFFNSLNSDMKKYFFEQLKQQGFINTSKSDDRNSHRRNTKQPSNKVSQLLPASPFERRDHIVMGDHRTQSPHHESRKRQSSFYKKTLSIGSNFYRENQTKATVDSQRKSGHLHFVIPELDQVSSNQTSDNQRIRSSAHNNDKQAVTALKSKKIISMRPTQNQTIEKARVFDIQDRSGGLNYSQKVVDLDSKSQSKLKSSYDIKDSTKEKQSNLKVRYENQLNPNKQLRYNDNQSQQQQANENDTDKKNQQAVNFSSKKLKKCYETGGVTENELQQNMQYNQNNQIKPSRQNKSKKFSKYYNNEAESSENQQISAVSRSRPRSRRNRSPQQQQQQYSSQRYSSNATSQNIRQQQYSRKMRPSCQLAIDQQNQQQNQSQKQIKIGHEANQQSKNSQKCSIFLQYNMIISTPPYQTNSDKQIMEQVKNNMKELQQKWQQQLKKQLKNSSEDVNNYQSIMQKVENSQKQSMNATLRKQKQKKLGPQNGRKQNSTQNDHRKTKSNLRNNTCVSVNGTFYKNNNDRVMSSSKQNHVNILSQTHESFGVKTQQNQLTRQKYYNHQKSLSKVSSMIRSSQHKDTVFKIQAEFADQEVAVASRDCATVEQFKDKVVTIHFAKCGPNCRHLQRYIEIFNKLKKNMAQNQRKLIKVHIQNMNQKLSLPGGQDQLALPSINRK